MSEQLKKFKLKWHRYEGWYWVGDEPCETLVREIEVVSAQDYDALAERLRECEVALSDYVAEKGLRHKAQSYYAKYDGDEY